MLLLRILLTLLVGCCGGLLFIRLKVRAGGILGAMFSVALFNVLTGLAVCAREDLDRPCVVCERTRVTFCALSEEEIAAYAASGEPMDKAAAYGVQARGGCFVERIEGCYYNVMGLPLSRLWRILGELGGKEKRLWEY